MKYNSEQLFQFAETGNYPTDVTIADLAGTKNQAGFTALHMAAECRHLPEETTAVDLISAEDQDGYTALDAWLSSLPVGNAEYLEDKFKERVKRQHKESLVKLLEKTKNPIQEKPLNLIKRIVEKVNNVDKARTAMWFAERMTEDQQNKSTAPK